MKGCPVCNAVYPSNQAFCKVDGKALVEVPDATAGVRQSAFLSWVQPPVKRRVPIWVWVLVGVGAFFFLTIFILPLLMFPALNSSRRHANEFAAKLSIQAILSSEAIYANDYPANGYVCSLAALGGGPSAGAPSPTAAQLLKSDLASGRKDGYIYTIGNCTKVTVKGMDRFVGYTIYAVPQTVGKTGNVGFCSDESGVIKSDPTGGTNCTQLVQ